MQKYFNSTKSYNLFRSLGASVDGETRTKFYGVVYKAYQEKQRSAGDLPTYQLTEDEIRALWDSLTTNTMQNGRKAAKH